MNLLPKYARFLVFSVNHVNCVPFRPAGNYIIINESLLVSTDKDSSIEESFEIDGYNIKLVKNFVYLCSSINSDNDISLEIRRRITLANRCYFGLRKQLSKIALSWRTKIYLYTR